MEYINYLFCPADSQANLLQCTQITSDNSGSLLSAITIVLQDNTPAFRKPSETAQKTLLWSAMRLLSQYSKLDLLTKSRMNIDQI